jgi:hypothetical protein
MSSPFDFPGCIRKRGPRNSQRVDVPAFGPGAFGRGPGAVVWTVYSHCAGKEKTVSRASVRKLRSESLLPLNLLVAEALCRAIWGVSDDTVFSSYCILNLEQSGGCTSVVGGRQCAAFGGSL